MVADAQGRQRQAGVGFIVRVGDVAAREDLILRARPCARLEGWRRVQLLRPSFETLAEFIIGPRPPTSRSSISFRRKRWPAPIHGPAPRRQRRSLRPAPDLRGRVLQCHALLRGQGCGALYLVMRGVSIANGGHACAGHPTNPAVLYSSSARARACTAYRGPTWRPRGSGRTLAGGQA
jgi:hypothetical protein